MRRKLQELRMSQARKDYGAERTEFNNKLNAWRDKRNAESRAYLDAKEAAENAIIDEIKKVLPFSDRLEFMINGSYTSDEQGFSNLSISISCKQSKHGELKYNNGTDWRFEVYLYNGEVRNQFANWHGLNNIDSEDIEELEDTLAILRKLAKIDWKPLLHRALPQHADFVTNDPPMPDGSEYEYNMNYAKLLLDDLVAEKLLIYGHASGIGYKIVKTTDKRVTYRMAYASINDLKNGHDVEADLSYYGTETKDKENFITYNFMHRERNLDNLELVIVDYNGNEVDYE